MTFLLGIFYVSGISALIYQVVWQRALLRIYGIDSTSVTVIVTAFMLGLGLGSLVGGRLSRRTQSSILPTFAALELAIGTYGCLSLGLFDLVARSTVGADHLLSGLIVFGMIALPTIAMGATLPLLVGHVNRRLNNTGRSVGMFYFANTLGAATGAFLTARVLLSSHGLVGTARLAAATNLLLAVLMIGVHWAASRQNLEPDALAEATA